MKIPGRKSKLDRVVDALPEFDVPGKPGKSVIAVAGGALGLAAGSALVSSLRRRADSRDA